MQGPPIWLHRDWLWGLILILAVILTYTPIWRAGFIWDDDAVLTANPCIVGPLGLKEIWTTSAADILSFRVLTTFWVEHALWGLAPLPYHLVNVLLHGACAVLLWRVLRSLRVQGAWLGAALWALHPVESESVAWITEMKNTESGLFSLLSIFFFVSWLRVKERDQDQPEAGGTIWPYPLITIYPRWQIDTEHWFSYLPLLAVIVFLSIFWLKRELWSRACFFAFAYFTAALLPVLGLIDSYLFEYSFVFDHLQYLASIGPLALMGTALVRYSDVKVQALVRQREK